MKAQSLSICVPNMGCNKNCPYCISKFTGASTPNRLLIERNIAKVVKLAETASVSSVILTGKGEPLLNIDDIRYFAGKFSDFPIEVQTNGLVLLEQDDLIKELYECDVNVVAFSFDRLSQFDQFKDVISQIKDWGIVVRVTFNVSDSYNFPANTRALVLLDFIDACKPAGVNQLSFRNITIPHNYVHSTASKKAQAAHDWIRQNTRNGLYRELVTRLREINAPLIRSLPFGAKVYDVYGIAVTYFDYCLQDSHTDEDIRSIIFEEDGHAYTAWNSKASILF